MVLEPYANFYLLNNRVIQNNYIFVTSANKEEENIDNYCNTLCV